MVTWARLKREDTGKAFYVYNTHFPTADDGGEFMRLRGAILLAGTIMKRAHPDEPFIITGDFNDTENSSPLRYLKGEQACPFPEDTIAHAIFCPFWSPPLATLDTYREQHPSSTRGTRCRNDSNDTGTRIDFVLMHSAGSELPAVERADILRSDNWSCASDHWPTHADLSLPIAAID
jgi:endonuclease/exonuclease/phosphatase family metal-dependent hydrolase